MHVNVNMNNVVSLVRWSYGIVLWEIFTIGEANLIHSLHHVILLRAKLLTVEMTRKQVRRQDTTEIRCFLYSHFDME